MAKHERIRAVRRAIGLVEGLIAAFDEVADELAELDDEVADAAKLSTASDRLTSAKDSAEAALAALRQWAKDAEANDQGEAGDRVGFQRIIRSQPLFRKIDNHLLRVADLDAAISFYADKLGHRLLWRSDQAAGFTLPRQMRNWSYLCILARRRTF
jgi:hypothetical protein